MVRRGSFIGGQDNLSVPDAPTIGAATVGAGQVSVAFTAPSDVGDDPITGYGASATDGTNVIGGTGSSSPVTITGLTNGTSYTAQVWAINDYGNGPLSAATSSFTPALNRAIMIGNVSGESTDTQRIDYVTVQSTGNATDFGDTIGDSIYPDAAGSDTRCIIYEGGGNTYSNVISYVAIATTGNATDFGDLTNARGYASSASNNVRSINAGGIVNAGGGTYQNVIDYITIPSTGDAIDFGDLLGTFLIHGSAASTTRILTGGGYGLLSGGPSNVYHVTVQYNTIASSGNSVDFGDLTVGRTPGALASATRAVFGPGSTGSNTNTMDYFTIASTGNATDFGDTTTNKDYAGGTADSTRGLFFGGADQNVIEYITVASTGNGTDFGDLTQNHAGKSGGHCSDVAAAQNESYFAPAAMGMFMGGVEPSGGLGAYGTTIEYIDIASTGNSAMFGDLSVARSYVGATGSSTRSVHAGGYTGSSQDVIDFVLFSTKGVATDFGNLLSAVYSPSGSGNNTRGIFAGSTPRSNVIQYITIASAGNATDFGDMTVSVNDRMSASSTTRSVMAAGFEASDDVDVIDYITIASTGDATDFGDLSVGTYQTNGAASSNTRAVFGLGRPYDASAGTSSTVNTLEYVTIASTGDTTDFGDLTVARYYANTASSKVRGVFAGGSDYPAGPSPYLSNYIDYITIASVGNATDFGDISGEPYAHGGSSNSHGGIS